MIKATVDGVVFEADTAQDLGVAVASYKNGLVTKNIEVTSDATAIGSMTISGNISSTTSSI